MNYDQARQLTDGSWNYSRQNDGKIYPIGYCASHENNGEFHRHKTKQEAEECYKKYMLDKELHLEAGTIGDKTAMKCDVKDCNEWTQTVTRVGPYWIKYLCNNHRNRETVEKLYTAGTQFTHKIPL